MGGSPVAAQEASDDDAARVVVRVAGSHVDSASNPLPPPGSATPAAEGEQEHTKPEAPAEAAAPAPVEAKQEAATAAAAAAGVQAMAVTVVRDVEAGRVASTSDQGGDKPSWFTPKR
jgi:MFS transporter, Spinster family, sphingosine-1-phosphate transporter